MSELVTQEAGFEALNALIIGGDMSKLTAKQKLEYYHGICKSIGLNALTNPFQYMKLNGKEVLYATKGAAEQIRNIKGISVLKQHIEWTDDLVIVTVEGKDQDGRIDTETGFAYILEPEEIRTGWDRANNKPIMGKNPKAGQKLTGEAKGNVLLKAITKAKRRLTLSMAGLGMLDETEVASIPGAQLIDSETGEVLEKIEKPKDIIIQEPYQIKVTTKYFKTKDETLPDWKAWGRAYCASLKVAMDSEVEEWLELNKDAFENCKLADTEVAAKVQEWIDYRTNNAAA